MAQPRQTMIAGTESPEDARVEAVATKLLEVRTRRMAATAEEVQVADELVEAMHAADPEATVYKRNGLVVELKPPGGKTKVKVKREEEPEPETDEG